MPAISSEALRVHRKKKHLSLAALAEKAGVNKTTIHRIERGMRRETQATTIERLAKGLGVTPETLLSDSPPTGEGGEANADSQSQLNVRVSSQARNALTLVARRYAVSPASIVALAPLLFLHAAEQSLRERQSSLDEIQRRCEEMRGVERTPHLSSRIVYDEVADEIGRAEQKSIDGRDLFGTMLESMSGALLGDEPLSASYEAWSDNPMAAYLKKITTELGDLAEFDGWDSYSQPNYQICREEALRVVGGDEVAADALLRGAVGIHELPKELRAADRVADRGPWVRERAEEARRETEEMLAGVMDSLNEQKEGSK
jgi:transcriptional regulator with XRE-family HTH domain